MACVVEVEALGNGVMGGKEGGEGGLMELQPKKSKKHYVADRQRA